MFKKFRKLILHNWAKNQVVPRCKSCDATNILLQWAWKKKEKGIKYYWLICPACLKRTKFFTNPKKAYKEWEKKNTGVIS